MKIAVWHNLQSGGAKRALYYHVRGLVERGHEVACWSLDTADHSYLPLSDFAPERVVAQPNHRARWRLSGRWTSHYAEAIDRMRAFAQANRICAGEIDSGDFDLLFANSSINYTVPYIIRQVRTKKVLYLQEPCRFMYEARPILPWINGAPEDFEQTDLFQPRRFMSDYPTLQTLRVQAKHEWLNVQACDRLLVNSYFSRETALRVYGVDAKVCYLGIDTNLFCDLGLEREQFVVGLGSFDSIKGIDLAVKAVALLHDPRPPLVWIANSGNEDYIKKTGELARTLGVDLSIRMGISDADLVTTLNKATLLLYTSRLEPFGLAPLEANACGLPVVAVAEGGVRETVRDGVNGFLVDPDPEKIACAATQLLRNPELARAMGKKAAENIRQNWNVEGSIDRLEAILEGVVSEKPSRASRAKAAGDS